MNDEKKNEKGEKDRNWRITVRLAEAVGGVSRPLVGMQV